MAVVNYRLKASDLLEERPDTPVLVVAPPVGPELNEEIALLSDPNALGVGSIAYLVYGVPGTDQYVFFDLNNLPQNYIATLKLASTDGTVHSVNSWGGKNGNSPQPTDQ